MGIIVKDPFYVFTDVKGVLSDQEKILEQYGPYLERAEYPILEASSVQALNNLLASLEENYDTRLIITSKLRKNLPRCINYLKSYGLEYDKPIFATEFKEGLRSEKIFDVMQKDGLSPARKKTLKQIISGILKRATEDKSFKNYVVIDRVSNTATRAIPKSHIIKTTSSEPLNNLQVNKFLSFLETSSQEKALQ